MFHNDLLAGKKILVTGGGTGLGKSIGRRYLELGAHLVICGRRLAVLDATADEFRAELPGARVDTLTCDVRDAEQVEAMMERIWQTGPLDVLVNNAAANFIARTDKLSARAVDAVLNIVLHGSFYCTIAAGRRWIEAGRPGNVISTVSAPVITGQAFTAPSAAAKAGVLAMTRSLAVEWGPKGIRLNCVAPGLFPTAGRLGAALPARQPGRGAGARRAAAAPRRAPRAVRPVCLPRGRRLGLHDRRPDRDGRRALDAGRRRPDLPRDAGLERRAMGRDAQEMTPLRTECTERKHHV